MNDYYLLLAPILTLLIVALVGFVGCSFTHGVVTDPLPFDGPHNIYVRPGDSFVDVTWDLVTGATSYLVKHGTVSGDYSSEHEVQNALTLHDDDVINGTRYYFAVTAKRGSAKSGLSPEAWAVPATSLITSTTNGSVQLTLDGWIGMGFETAQQLTVHRLGRYWEDNKLSMTIKLQLVNGGIRTDVPGGACTVLFDNVEPDGFNYAYLPQPITLLANSQYFLLCQAIPGEKYYDAINSTVTTTAAVTRVFPVYADAADTYVSNLNGHIYGPVNFTYSL
jgi:hypothetical protein